VLREGILILKVKYFKPLIYKWRYMRYLSDRQIKQLLCEHFSKVSFEPHVVRTQLRSRFRSENDRHYNKADSLAGRSL
jgi:hypothetical protein